MARELRFGPCCEGASFFMHAVTQSIPLRSIAWAIQFNVSPTTS